MASESVKVVVRCRPMNQRERELNCQPVVTVDSARGQCFIQNPSATDEPPKQFTFDGAYFMDHFTEQIYNEIAYPLVEVSAPGGRLRAPAGQDLGRPEGSRGTALPPGRRRPPGHRQVGLKTSAGRRAGTRPPGLCPGLQCAQCQAARIPTPTACRTAGPHPACELQGFSTRSSHFLQLPSPCPSPSPSQRGLCFLPLSIQSPLSILCGREDDLTSPCFCSFELHSGEGHSHHRWGN